jgi:diguanylate cyclase (GGDEF)-like protein
MEDGAEREVNIYMHHADGHRLPVLVRATPIYNDDGEIVGAVEVFSDNSSKITALEKIKELQQASLLDSLTGVGNRRYAEMELNARLNELKRHGSTFGVIFVDIDQFKNVNDIYGHQAGDQALKMVAKTLSSNLRSYDFIGRWGGEEFLIISDSGDDEGLLAVADKLRILVEKSIIYLEDGNICVTISMGATIAQENDTVKSLMERADKLLYVSKQNGRNRVTLD